MPCAGDKRPLPDRFFEPLNRMTKRPQFPAIKFKYHSTQKASYCIKRVLIHILSGHVLELITNRIFYGFLNIYKILRLSPAQNTVKFQRPKITSDT